jgi:hypothetical protein
MREATGSRRKTYRKKSNFSDSLALAKSEPETANRLARKIYKFVARQTDSDWSRRTDLSMLFILITTTYGPHPQGVAN